MPGQHQPAASQVTGGLAGPHSSTSTVLAGLLVPTQQLWTRMVCPVQLVSSCADRGDWRLQSRMSIQEEATRMAMSGCLSALPPQLGILGTTPVVVDLAARSPLQGSAHKAQGAACG